MSPARRKPAETTTCPWCSATVPASSVTCPSCGAALRDAPEADILGVTQVDPGAISRASRIKPGRLASLLGADQVDAAAEIGGRVEPPSAEVREEMLRLELAALDAEIEAKAAQAAAERELGPEDTAAEAAAGTEPLAVDGADAGADGGETPKETSG
jgi:hypothetical protein